MCAQSTSAEEHGQMAKFGVTMVTYGNCRVFMHLEASLMAQSESQQIYVSTVLLLRIMGDHNLQQIPAQNTLFFS